MLGKLLQRFEINHQIPSNKGWNSSKPSSNENSKYMTEFILTQLTIAEVLQHVGLHQGSMLLCTMEDNANLLAAVPTRP